MKVLYHIGENIGRETIMKKGIINENLRPLKLEAEDSIILNDLRYVDFYNLDVLGTIIRLQNGFQIIYLAVPRLYFNIGTGFVIINYFKTRRLKQILESIR